MDPRKQRTSHLLATERRNPRTRDMDALDTRALVSRLTDEELKVARAVRAVSNDVARAVDLVVSKLRSGGRLIYVGAGTSGRICVLDAASCASTFGVPRDKVIAVVAGKGHRSEREINAEDDEKAAELDLGAYDLGPSDVVFGVAASGHTPFVVAGIKLAKTMGAATIGLTANPSTPLATLPDVVVVPRTGAESLTGSTRMKAGTAQKIVLNIVSTAAMVRLGKTYSNLMVDFVPQNEKLKRRAVRIVSMATGVAQAIAERAIHETEDVKLAILRISTGFDLERCRKTLIAHGNVLREALAASKTSQA